MKLLFTLRIHEPEVFITQNGDYKDSGTCSPTCPYLQIIDPQAIDAFCNYLQVDLDFYDWYLAECTTTVKIKSHHKREFKLL